TARHMSRSCDDLSRCGWRYLDLDTAVRRDRAMNKAVTVGVGILAILTGLCVLHAADPDQKEVVVEDKPLRSWLEQAHGPLEGQEKAQAVLRRFCADPERAVPALTAVLADKKELVRLTAAECLGYYCKAELKSVLPPLLKTLREDESSYVRKAAAESLSVV